MRRVWRLYHVGLVSPVGNWGFILDTGQPWSQLRSVRTTGCCGGWTWEGRGTRQRRGGYRDAVSIIQGCDEEPRPGIQGWGREERRLRLFSTSILWDSLTHSMGGEGQSGETGCCRGFEEAQAIAPFLLPKFWTNWEIKQKMSNVETKISHLLLLKLMLENVSCVSDKCDS